jgi:Trypsin-co-occurring domain 2
MIELSTVIRELRRELSTAIGAAAGERLQLGLGPIELEVSVAITSGQDAGGKVRFWVVELGTDLKDAETTTQRIKLTLQPALADSAEPPYVSGRTGDRER